MSTPQDATTTPANQHLTAARDTPPATTPAQDRAGSLPSDGSIITAIWPMLLASAVGLLPFTVFATFLVAIADAVGDSEAAVGSLRGLGGIGAVLVGVAAAPLIGRLAPPKVAAAALVLLAGAALLGTMTWLPSLVIFCLAVGASNALLYPALSTAAADHFEDSPAASRAATLVMTTQTLAATLAAPLTVMPALWWGWRGNLVAIAALALLTAPALLHHNRRHHVHAPTRKPGYLEAFRLLAAVPGTRLLLLVAFGRAGAFMGHVSFLAPLYADRFDLSPTAFGFVWTLSGTSFFIGHYISGRILASEDPARAHRAMMTSLLIGLTALLLVHTAPALPLALAGTALLAASHAVVAAAILTLLVQRCRETRGTALSLNAASMSLGLFLGTALGGAALAVGGYQGAAGVFIVLTLISILAGLAAGTRTQPAPTKS